LPSIITRIAIAIAGLTIGQAKPLVAAALEIPFTLSKPAGDGPFPAVVILHDCSGLGPRSRAVALVDTACRQRIRHDLA
jgi:hypothetical protein